MRGGRAALGVLLGLSGGAALAEGVPTRPGRCVETRIAAVEHRLQQGEHGPFIAESGSAVRFANGGYQVSYDEVDAVTRSRVGDPVRMCLVQLPRDCPKGDTRGRVYATTNLRTRQSWTMPDAEHACGGA